MRVSAGFRGVGRATGGRRVRLGPRVLIGGAIIAALSLVALLAPVIAPNDPIAVDTSRLLQPPGPSAWLGTDDLGRDVFSRIVWGARVSLSVGFISVGIGLIVGVSLGMISGYGAGWVDLLVMRVIDALLAFPPLLLALAITAALGPQLQNAMIAIGVLAVPVYARLARGQVLTIRHRDFILAARAVGIPSVRILTRHIFPNIVNPLIVMATLWAGFAILTEASLSFLGLGIQPPQPSWGQDIAYSQRQIFLGRWWTVFGPGAAIFLAVIGFNMLGDGLRDAFDPRLRRSG
jgi:ABC-type dipeptide/oligopeptide/nickel transport system permease subunit